MTPEPSVEDEIRSFITDTSDFFARWGNGRADRDEIEWIASRISEDWCLINAAMPGIASDRDGFLSFFPSLHGRFAEDPVTPRIDFLVVGQLAAHVFLTSIVRHHDFASGKRDSRVMTQVIVRENGSLRVQHVHE